MPKGGLEPVSISNSFDFNRLQFNSLKIKNFVFLFYLIFFYVFLCFLNQNGHKMVSN